MNRKCEQAEHILRRDEGDRNDYEIVSNLQAVQFLHDDRNDSVDPGNRFLYSGPGFLRKDRACKQISNLDCVWIRNSGRNHFHVCGYHPADDHMEKQAGF